MTDPAVAARPPIQTMRILAWSLMGALVVIGVALVFVYEGQLTETPPVWAVAVVAVLGVGAWLLIDAVGYRVPAIRPGTPQDEAAKASVAAFQSAMIRRFAMSEVVALVALAVGARTEEGPVVLYALGVVAAFAPMSVHVLPGERVITRTEEALQREGGTSYLRLGLGC